MRWKVCFKTIIYSTSSLFIMSDIKFKIFYILYVNNQEHFLVPNHRIKNISGASFAGFYYICYDRCTDTIMGFYFHQVCIVKIQKNKIIK